MAQGLIRYPGAGCVVEFMQGNAPQIAWVLEEQGGRLRLLLPNRREMALQAARLLPWAGPQLEGGQGREAALEHLEHHRSVRDELAESINPQELWELAQGEMEKASAQWFAELTTSNPNADAVAACGHVLLQFKSHFKFQPPDFEVLSLEVVQGRMAEQEAAARREALVAQGSTFLRRLWEAHARHVTPAPVELDPEVERQLRTMLLERMADPEARDDADWRQLSKGLPEDPFLPLQLAEAWGLVPPHYNIWLDRAGYAPGNAWSEPYRDEALRLAEQCEAQSAAALENADSGFLSIDSASTLDIDDAFQVSELPEGGWRLNLALACPALLWPFGSELDKAVLRRATSLYLPEATHHMLPEELGANGFSLLADRPRAALLVCVDIGPDGAVLDCRPSLGHVRLIANLRYDDCEAVFDGHDSPASAHAQQLHIGLALAEARRAYRVGNGAVIIERPDLNLTLEGEGEDIRVLLEEEAPADRSHLLVSEHMILVNAALAVWAKERGIALLHRTQNVGIPKEYAGVWRDPFSIARVVRALAPSSLECVPKPHAGVGEAAYAPSTSPLRRYPDLINEAQILHFLEHGTPRWQLAELEALLPMLNARLDAAAQVQRFRPRYWKYMHVRQRGDVWWPAVITDENDAYAYVNIPAIQVSLRARRSLFGDRTRPGQALEVRLGKIRPRLGEMAILETRDVADASEA